jgi:RNA polymerase sigma-70 factor (ECF subfamily)
MNKAKSLAIPQLFAENAAGMRRLALSLVRDESRAEDVLQETWLEVLRRPPRTDASPLGWLRTALRNFARKQHREEGRRARREHAVARAEITASDPAVVVERAEVHQRLLSFVLELAEPYRSAILLHFFEALRPVDIARRQEIPVTTVSSRIHHGLDLLKARLEREHSGTWQALLILTVLHGAGARTVAAASGISSLKLTGLVAGAGTVTNQSVASTCLATGAILMGKKAVFAVCLSAVAVLSGGLGLWYATSPREDHGTLAGPRVEESAKYKGLLSELQSTRRGLAAALKDNELLSSAKKDLETKLAKVESPGAAAAKAEDGVQPGEDAVGSGLSWAELSSLIAGNPEILGKLARNERLEPEEQSKYQLLEGELLKLSSKAKLKSKDPFFDEVIFRELVSALFRGPLSLSEKQGGELEALLDKIFTGAPENLDEKSSLERYQLRKDTVSRLEQGVEKLLDEDQRQTWQGVQNFAHMAFTYGGKLVEGTSAQPRSLLVNWWSNALGTQMDDGALQAVTPISEAYLERARAALSRYGESNEALNSLTPEARATLDGEFLRLQKAFYEEVGSHLSPELRRKLYEDDPLIIRFEFGQRTYITGRRRYF